MDPTVSSVAGVEEVSTFHWADYLVFFIILGMSSAVGLYYGVAGRSKTTEDFLMAGRSMPLLPVSLSLFVSWLSAISFVGDPVEVYMYGSVYWVIGLGYCLALPLVAHVFAPVYYRARLTSAYQYLKERYNVHVRTLGSVVNGVGTATYLGIALYAPCLALSQMSGLETWHAILLVGGVCTFYTSLGGMKAVLWADTIQTVVMLVGLLALLFIGGSAAGGASKIMEVASEGGRLNFTFDPNPARRATVWTYLIGGFFRVLNPYISVQLWIQRYCTVRNERDLKIALYLNILYFFVFISLFAMIGLIMTAYFHDCDPLHAGKIKSRDQMVPLLVMETMGFLPGVPGLFLACLISASLSTLSSGQSGLATTCLKDVIEPIYHKLTGQRLKDKSAIVAAVVLSVFFGILNIGLALFIYGLKDATIFSITLTLQGAFTGPIAGIFFLGVIFTSTSTLTAMIAALISLAVSLWFSMGAFFDRPPPHPLDKLPIALCPATSNLTYTNGWTDVSTMSYPSNATPETATSGFQVNSLYGLSPVLFNALGFGLTILIGLVIILIQRLRKKLFKKSQIYHVEKPAPQELERFNQIPE